MKKETSCINSRVILDYVKAYNNGDCSGLFGNLDPELDELDDPEAFLSDPNNWIPCSVISKLHERARLIFQDEMTGYKIAKFGVERTLLGYAQKIIVKAFWSYKNALKNLQKLNDKYNKSKRVELVQIKKNEAIIRLHWFPGMDVTKDICLYNQGAYTFMPLIWGGRPLNLREECCYFDGSPYCEYHLQLPAGNKFHEIFSRLFTSKSVLRETIREMERDKKLLEQKYEEVNRLNEELNNRIKQLIALQETGKAILSVLDLKCLLSVIMNTLSNVCHINRAVIMLVNEEDKSLKFLHGTGFGSTIPREVKDYKVPLDRLNNILVRVTNTGQSEYVPDVDSSSLRKENILLTYGKPRSVYVAPLITRSRVIGVLATDAADESGVPKETRETLEVFAPQIAIAIENARLYNRLQEQMEELKRSRGLLTRAEKFSFLGNLAARLAHEIKNPMTAIGTFIQMLPRKYNDAQFRKDFYQIGIEETNRINSLITELLDLVKTKESHFAYSDLHDLIDKTLLLVSPQSKAKNIEVVRRYDPDVRQVKIDPEKIKQAILNLLSNALEFTPERGRIEIRTQKCVDGGDERHIRIEVQDSGVGISESIMDKVFDPYFTTKHKSSMNSGTGLGLFIVHQHVLHHGGTIGVESKPNKGTRFTIRLPIDSSSTPSPVEEEHHAN